MEKAKDTFTELSFVAPLAVVINVTLALDAACTPDAEKGARWKCPDCVGKPEC